MTQEKSATSPESKRVLGLIASSRRLGNCEVFAKEVANRIPGDKVLYFIRLTELDIGSCRGCYTCIMGGPCPLNDHMFFLKEQILRSDALIISAPVYFFGTHSIIKRVLDRGFLFYEDAEQNAHKPCVLINIYGITEKMGVAPQMLRALAGVLCLRVKASVNVRAALPGEVLMNERNLDLAQKMAELLFSPAENGVSEGCPHCGCEIVRMRGRELICTLCQGTFILDAKGSPVKRKAGAEIGTVKFVRDHSAWLKDMKDKYIGERKELLRLTLPYKDIGAWIEPPEE